MNTKTTKGTKDTTKQNQPSKNWHEWTEQQIEYLCCLRTKTTLSYQKISEIFAACLNVNVPADILRYKCNVLKGSLAPSQAKRRVREFGGNNAWSKFTDLPESSPEVQAVYRDCKIFDDYDGVEDSTALQPRSPEPACKSPYAPSNPPARRSTPTASEASSPSSETRSSSSTEVELSPEPAPTSSSRLYLPPTPNKDPASPNKNPASPNNDPASPIKEPDFIPYMWDYFETVFLCVLSIHARLSSKEIASILKEKDGSEVDEEDVELKIDELSGEEYGIWETWGAKNLDDSEVQTVLRRLGRIE